MRIELGTIFPTGEITQTDREGIIEVVLDGTNVYTLPTIALLNRYGVLQQPERYLLRSINKAGLASLIQNGTERDETSNCRDKNFEADFGVGPGDYTYCFIPNQQRLVDADVSRSLAQDNAVVFYHADALIQHTEPRYDDGTGTLYSFKNPSQKRKAVYLVMHGHNWDKTAPWLPGVSPVPRRRPLG